ncbi:hypothetical protein [Paenibacillus sp. TSA_86.1]|uniref:hypothetical protein n=1 Tax=Paenibacillus sp. TSA_86.1 TaxID=3415649 RepID=UPI004045FAF5
MRKKVLTTLISLTKSLQDAVSHLEILLRMGRHTDALEILKGCQEGAINIGTTIEQQSVPNASQIIKRLENFCESVYQVYINLENRDYQAHGALINLSSQLQEIEFVIKEIKVKYEVVFLPYKASMWDSMESVWKAANEDPNCNCYVIPIPYFERIKDSENSLVKYEGMELPSYVTKTSFEQYDFNQKMPDIIYIHNPYDQYNNVTSVHPAFYSSVLKKYTEMLVYIPYYVTGGSVSTSLLSLPSYQNIDKIITQSNSSTEFFGNYVSKDKLVALGSPKIDKVLSLSNERERKSEMDEMTKGKKVIFYNTSLSSIYQYKEKSLQKMKLVFSIFEKRENEVLFWRPHPLVKATLQSTFPELYKEYSELEQEFIINKIGILDTSADISQAVAYSDAYIGEEGSSVIHLFGVLGKPIFLLNIDTFGVDESRTGFVDACVEGDLMWFSHIHFNAICNLNIRTGEVEIVDTIIDEALFNERLYHDNVKIGNKLYFAPSRAREMTIYDLETRLSLKGVYEDGPDNIRTRFTRMVQHGNFLYMLPLNYSALVRYDMYNGTFKYYPEVVDKVKALYSNKIDGLYFMNAFIIEGDLLLMAAAQTNVILEFNMITENINLYRVGKSENGFYGMEYDGENYWIIPNGEGSIMKWNRKTGHALEFNSYPEGFLSGGHGFYNILPFEGYMLMFPKYGNMIVKIDTDTGIMSEYPLSLPYKEGERESERHDWQNNYYYAKKINDTEIIALTAYNSSLIRIDTVKNQAVVTKTDNVKRKSKLVFKSCGDNLPYACREGILSTIEDFLNALNDDWGINSEKQKKAYEAVISNMDGTSGLKIHQYMIDQMVDHT